MADPTACLPADTPSDIGSGTQAAGMHSGGIVGVRQMHQATNPWAAGALSPKQRSDAASHGMPGTMGSFCIYSVMLDDFAALVA